MDKRFAVNVKKVNSDLSHSIKVKHPDKDEYLDCKEVMGILNISRVTLIKHTKKGNLISYRFGGRVMYKQDEITSGLLLFKKLLRKRNTDRKPSVANSPILTSFKQSKIAHGK